MKKNILRNTIMAMSFAIMPLTAFASYSESIEIDGIEVPADVFRYCIFNYLPLNSLFNSVGLVSKDMHKSVSLNLESRLNEISNLLICVNPEIKNKQDAIYAMKEIVLKHCISHDSLVKDILELDNDKKLLTHLKNESTLYKKLFKQLKQAKKSCCYNIQKDKKMCDNLTIVRMAFLKFSNAENNYITLKNMDDKSLMNVLHGGFKIEVQSCY